MWYWLEKFNSAGHQRVACLSIVNLGSRRNKLALISPFGSLKKMLQNWNKNVIFLLQSFSCETILICLTNFATFWSIKVFFSSNNIFVQRFQSSRWRWSPDNVTVSFLGWKKDCENVKTRIEMKCVVVAAAVAVAVVG